jgi:hypothetical protein
MTCMGSSVRPGDNSSLLHDLMDNSKHERRQEKLMRQLWKKQ